MVHFGMFIVMIVAFVIVAALLFVSWLVVIVLRGITRLLLGPGLKPSPKRVVQRDPSDTRRCIQNDCRAINVVEARFCRRCGRRMDDPQHVSVRRAVA